MRRVRDDCVAGVGGAENAMPLDAVRVFKQSSLFTTPRHSITQVLPHGEHTSGLKQHLQHSAPPDEAARTRVSWQTTVCLFPTLISKFHNGGIK